MPFIYDFLAKLIKIITVGALFFFVFLGHLSVNAAKKEIDINTNPNGYFFKVGNLKPGDWMPRDITILNEGTQDFRYMATVGKKKSVKGLFEELELIVKKDEKVLYEGKMDDFKGFTPRKLKMGSSETLFFQVTMPYELGNAFQSSEAVVEILFVAEAIGEPGGETPPGPPGEENPPGKENPPEDKNPPGNENPPKDEEPPSNKPPSGDEPKDDTNPPENNSSPDSPEGNDAEEVNSEENEPAQIPDQIVISPEMTENLLPNMAINTYNILLMGVGLLGCGGTLIIFYRRRFRRDQ